MRKWQSDTVQVGFNEPGFFSFVIYELVWSVPKIFIKKQPSTYLVHQADLSGEKKKRKKKVATVKPKKRSPEEREDEDWDEKLEKKEKIKKEKKSDPIHKKRPKR